MVSLPYHQRLVRSMLAYDLIGFQTEEWLESFHHYVERELGGTVAADGTIEVDGRRGEDRRLPDRDRRARVRECRSTGRTRATPMRRCTGSAEGRKVIIGVDRLDYSKGLAERFNGYRRFLEENPDWLGRVSFLQIAPPSRGEVHTYEHIRDELDALSGPDQRRSSPMSTGCRSATSTRAIRATSCPASTAPRTIALVTPLRDGMNLVAKEYVAAQDPDDPGRADPLALRRRGAPAAARRCWSIPTARTRSPTRSARRWTCRRAERIRRWEALIDTVRREDVLHWRHAFVEALAATGAS